jgi:hypothetical protein
MTCLHLHVSTDRHHSKGISKKDERRSEIAARTNVRNLAPEKNGSQHRMEHMLTRASVQQIAGNSFPSNWDEQLCSSAVILKRNEVALSTAAHEGIVIWMCLIIVNQHDAGRKMHI